MGAQKIQHPHCDTAIVKRVYFDALTPPRLPIPKMRKALQSLQGAGGAYCLVAAHEDHDVRGSLRGFQAGDSLRVLRPKENEGASQQQQKGARYPGYALKITWDVPEGKAMGMLKVNACWHEIVFKN